MIRHIETIAFFSFLAGYFLVGLRKDAASFFTFLLIIFLVIQVGFALSQVLSAIAKSVNMAIALYMVILVYSLLMGGFMV